MGRAARANPMSPSFTGSISGSIPRLKLEAAIVAEIVPSQAWIDANRPADGAEWPECPASEAVVRYSVKTAALFPSRFSPPHKWPHGEAITGVLDDKPLPEVMAHMIRANDHLVGPWAALLREDAEREGKAPEEAPAEPAAETSGES